MKYSESIQGTNVPNPLKVRLQMIIIQINIESIHFLEGKHSLSTQNTTIFHLNMP